MTLSKITAPAVLVTSEDLKANVPSIKSAIKSALRVDCSTTSALDIGAAAVGLNDYRSFKCQTDKVHVQLRGNMGNDNAPCYTYIDIGFFGENCHTEIVEQAKSAVKNCLTIMTWEILKNGEECGMRFLSDEGHEGLRLTVTINGETYSDLELALQEVMNGVENELSSGFDGNQTTDYKFYIHGDELVPNIEVVEDEYYVIIDNNGTHLYYEKSELALAKDAFEGAGDEDAEITEWEGDLRLLKSVEFDEYSDEQFIALDSKGVVEYELSGQEMMNELKRDRNTYYIYQEVDTKR